MGAIVQYKVGHFADNIGTMLWTVGPGAAIQMGQCASPGPVHGLTYDRGNNVSVS